MMRGILAAVVLASATAPAGAEEGLVAKASRAVAESTAAKGAALVAPVLRLQPPPRAARPARRPSLVGYIADGVVGSQVRLRFDAGFQMTAPDRAEFFYAKCGCYAGLQNHPTLSAAFDPNAPGPAPGIVEDIDFRQLYLYGELAATDRVSVFSEVPFRWLDPQSFAPPGPGFGRQSGLSDIRFGAKLGVVAEPTRHLTVQFQVFAPSGRPEKGLGVNHWSLDPALLYNEWLTERFAIEAQLGAVIPTDGSAGVPITSSENFSGTVLYYGFGPSFELFPEAAVGLAPVVELVGWRLIGGFQTSRHIEADGTSIVNLKVGGRITFGDQGSVYVGYGRAITDESWYRDVIRAEYRYSF